MVLVTKRELKQLIHPHYIFELILAFSYVILKGISYTSVHILGTSAYSSKETELLIFVAILVALKTRRRGHVNFLPYLSSACTMAKFGNFLLFFFVKPMYGLTYSILLLVHILMFPKPMYKGPQKVTHFISDNFEKELVKDKSVKWLVEFYVTWNPECNEFSGVFGELSAKFAKEKLRFGKIDISRCPKVAEKYSLQNTVTSKTLPTVILFKDGKESDRRPHFDSRNRVIPFSFSYENVISAFNLTTM